MSAALLASGEWVPWDQRPEVIQAREREKQGEALAAENAAWRAEHPSAAPVGAHRAPVPVPAPVSPPAESPSAPARPAVPKIVNNAKPAWARGLSPDTEQALGRAVLAEQRKATRAPSRRSRGSAPASPAASVDGYPIHLSAEAVEALAREAVGDQP